MRIAARAALSASLILAATQAWAHHPMNGELPSTRFEGLLSGLAHPVIGLDHLAFVVAAGVLAAVMNLSALVPLAFVAASLVGVGLHVALLHLPGAEPAIAISVLAAGGILAAARGLSWPVVAAFFGLVGLFHGYAYGESIVGAEQAPLGAYLAGLALVQSAVTLGAFAVAKGRRWLPQSIAPRMVGAAVAGIGLSAAAGQLFG